MNKPSSYISKLRKLTEKSKLGVTKAKDRTVSELLISQTGKQHLIWMYFHLEAITFMDNILDELSIKLDDRINKPGANPDGFKNYDKGSSVRIGRLKLGREMGNPKPETYSKRSLQAKNHGK